MTHSILKPRIWKSGTWTKGKRTLHGTWCHIQEFDKCMVLLDSKDPVTGRSRWVETKGPIPNFNGWTYHEETG